MPWKERCLCSYCVLAPAYGDMSWVGQMLSWGCQTRDRGGPALAKVARALPGSMACLILSWCDSFCVCLPEGVASGLGWHPVCTYGPLFWAWYLGPCSAC